jgi:hypothetical protein
MKQKLITALAAGAVLAAALATTTPANAHHPRSMWYHGHKYYLSDYYDSEWCFHHHGYNYCQRHDSY